jgi:hypothetical protein
MKNKMNELTQSYLIRAETWAVITTLAYFLLNGAQIFETVVLVPKWTQAPPDSFHYFKGKYGMDLKTFWIAAHSIHEITFILAIIFCWKIDPVRNWFLILFTVHMAVRAWTILYFAPNVMEFQAVANGSEASPDLLSRTALWRNLNYIRVGVFVAVSVCLIPLCMKVLNLMQLQGK